MILYACVETVAIVENVGEKEEKTFHDVCSGLSSKINVVMELKELQKQKNQNKRA